MFSSQSVILFGSHAWGKPTDDSDVDLLVIMPFQGKSWKMASEIRKVIKANFAIDLLVRTPEQFNDRLSMGDSFISEIAERGKTLELKTNPSQSDIF